MDSDVVSDLSGAKAAAAWAPAKARLRVALVWLHRWLGLSLGLLLVVIGLTGSFIVFYREIDAALNPSLYTPAGPQHRLEAAEVMRIAATVDSAPIRSVIAPDRTWPVWIVMHSHATEKGRYPSLWTTMIDPSNGKVLGPTASSAIADWSSTLSARSPRECACSVAWLSSCRSEPSPGSAACSPDRNIAARCK